MADVCTVADKQPKQEAPRKNPIVVIPTQTIQTSTEEQKPEYTLQLNFFDPAKFSPNLFMTKLEMRMKQYHLEETLNNDVLHI